jgi:hypothetical protein
MGKTTTNSFHFRSGALLGACLILALTGPVCSSDGNGVQLLFHEDFESYQPGILEPGGDADINERWYTFRTEYRKSKKFSPEVQLLEGAGVDGSRGLRLFAGLRKLTTGSFFLGVRHKFTADLGGVELERLRFTAQARAEVRDVRSGRTMILPEEFIFAWRLESTTKARGRGMRQFNATAMGAFDIIGGPLSQALSGRKLDYSELRLAEGSAEYQIVLVLSSCCIGPVYRNGSYDIEIYLDDIRLELTPPDGIVPDHELLDTRFSPDDCRSGWPNSGATHGARLIR